MQQRTLTVLSTASLIALSLSLACSKSKALTPTTPTPPVVTPAGGATLKVTAPTPQSPNNGVRIETFSQPTLTATAATPTEGGNFTPQYEFELMSDSGALIERSSLRNSSSWTPAAEMDFDKTYTWRVRAIFGGDAGPWSTSASFRSPDGGYIRGKQIFDPLTNGRSVGTVIGGHFVTGPNGGWQADAMDHAIDYDIPTCDACKVEFDVTNFGAGEGMSIGVDVKWFSMGDAPAMAGGFIPFRNDPWKMHLEQRSDGDGTGMQLIWRNGAADADSGGDPDYGDHRGKFLNGGPNWGHSYDNKVWHFVIEWTRTTYQISIGENGGPQRVWFPGAGSTGFFGGGHAYAPPNHRLELGCRPRAETMVGARFRNFKVTPQ
jgi:hypothetical protein